MKIEIDQDEFNKLIKTYIKENLSIAVSVDTVFGNGETIEVEVTLYGEDGEEITSDFDRITLDIPRQCRCDC